MAGRKRRHRFLYGKWTDFLSSTDMRSYEEYDRSGAGRPRQEAAVGVCLGMPPRCICQTMGTANSVRVLCPFITQPNEDYLSLQVHHSKDPMSHRPTFYLQVSRLPVLK